MTDGWMSRIDGFIMMVMEMVGYIHGWRRDFSDSSGYGFSLLSVVFSVS